MKTLFFKNIFFSLAAVSFMLVGCQRPSGSGLSLESFQQKSNVLVTQFAREVSYARGFRAPSSDSQRGFTQQQFGAQAYPTDINERIQQCLDAVKNTPILRAEHDKMAGVLAQCLEQLLVYANPVASMGLQSMDPTTAQNYAYLMNYQGNGALPQTSMFNGFGSNLFQGLGIPQQSPSPQCGMSMNPFNPQCFGGFGQAFGSF